MDKHVIWVEREGEIFLQKGLDRGIRAAPVGQISPEVAR
jgi:hypothetical protein